MSLGNLKSVTIQSRSHVPGTRPLGHIPGPRPNECKCSWAWSADGGQYLKFVNAACLVHFGIKTIAA